MTGEKPCCPTATARMIKKLTLPGGFQVGITNLENILKPTTRLSKKDCSKGSKFTIMLRQVQKLITRRRCARSINNNTEIQIGR